MSVTGAAPPEAKRWRDLRKRVLSALVLGPTAIACVWLGATPWTVLMAIAVAILAWEWVHLCGLHTRALPGAAVPLAVLGAGAFAVAERPALALGCLLAGFLLTWVASRGLPRAGRRVRLPPLRLALGVLYIGIAGIALIELRHDNEAGRDNVLFLLLVVWASDIGAYLAGRALGGPRLMPSVSPNKTWSGALGGLLLAVIVGLVAARILAPGAVLWAAPVAVLISLMAQAGDLLESAIKRHFAVKDTSSLIPGHGGLLDRLDGVLAAAPVAALLAMASGQGSPIWQ
ncbi:phosphatidate cytidylyltransferase [Plastoroseomonas arctica]|uniref:Phosphatidate cytidylyltransferase n=1 Tax=Plastoroseomonas arctica TaxID=1509237 RepID=A0AAF1JZ90_9PROT|nr:phosphatidate cytidylyltransferase [Plastoroseomonas arctica]MBR0657352.1 phosphatidate cytidylyltransferase [Plastoroseomonas arctica]